MTFWLPVEVASGQAKPNVCAQLEVGVKGTGCPTSAINGAVVGETQAVAQSLASSASFETPASRSSHGCREPFSNVALAAPDAVARQELSPACGAEADSPKADATLHLAATADRMSGSAGANMTAARAAANELKAIGAQPPVSPGKGKKAPQGSQSQSHAPAEGSGNRWQLPIQLAQQGAENVPDLSDMCSEQATATQAKFSRESVQPSATSVPQQRASQLSAMTETAQPVHDSSVLFTRLAVGEDGSQVARQMEVAFAAHLSPARACEGEVKGGVSDEPQSSLEASVPPQSSASRLPAPETPEAPTAAVEPNASHAVHTFAESATPGVDKERGRRPSESLRIETPPASGRDASSPPNLVEGGSVSQAMRANAAEEATQGTTLEPAAALEPPTPSAARDIKLQVGGEGDRRVEVRVMERGGDVHVAVRTPDVRLAGELREDLPVLTARLEQTGFRTETWHPAATGGGERSPGRLAEAASGTGAQDTQSQSRQGGREQRDQPEPRPKEPQASAQPTPDSKDFAWLLSALQ